MSALWYSAVCLISAFGLWVVYRVIVNYRQDRRIQASWREHCRNMGGEK